jgi:hypothetical protein
MFPIPPVLMIANPLLEVAPLVGCCLLELSPDRVSMAVNNSPSIDKRGSGPIRNRTDASLCGGRSFRNVHRG